MNKNRLFFIIFSISLLLFLLLFSYKTTLFFTDLTEEQDNTIQYLQNKEELQLNYTSEELSHLQDVKKVMRKADYVFYVLLLLATISLTHHKKNKEQLQKEKDTPKARECRQKSASQKIHCVNGQTTVPAHTF